MVLQRWENIFVWCFVLLNISRILGANDPCQAPNGSVVDHGEMYKPFARDSCTTCLCVNGKPGQCFSVMCKSPECSNFAVVPDRCCEYVCLEPDGPAQQNVKQEVNFTLSTSPGSTVQLECPIQNPRGLPNIWSFKTNILSLDTTKITREERYQTARFPDSKTGNLIIAGVKPDDEGLYECRIDSEPPYVIKLEINGAREKRRSRRKTRNVEEDVGDGDKIPHFDNSTSINITTRSGTTAYLPCRVHHVGDRTVSWIRVKNIQILTVGKFTYTNDARFQTLHLDNSDDWTLQIKNIQHKDAGLYECHVGPPLKISHFVMLNVIVSKAEIQGGPTLYIKLGRTLALTCEVAGGPEPPVHVFWYHEGRAINYGPRRGILVSIDRGPITTSRLTIPRARHQDSGSYACVPSNAEQATIMVNVLNGAREKRRQRKTRNVEEDVGDRDKIPYFDNSTSINITTTSGTTAYLPCRVRHVGDRTVSWIRKKDLHILTVGKFTYTNDARFQTLHLDNSDDWTLQVKYTQHKDAGLYECQVSTVPKMSHFVMLNVIVSKAEIQGGPTLYINSGSTLALTCEVAGGPEPPVYVFWYHEGRAINYGARRGILASIDRGPITTSRLTVPRAGPQDSGSYSCVPSNAEQAAIMVHVLNGENPAAMQHGKHPSLCSRTAISWHLSSILPLWVVLWTNKR